MSTLARFYHILQKPVITEKASRDTAKRNAYQFRVPLDANKIEVRRAVEKLFNVKVKDVRTANYHGKQSVQMTKKARHQGLRSSWKKAYVTLAEGQTIEAFDIA